ncbi:HNH endonuclease [Mesorhizobium sp. PUT5]|uniref:HNH endonuclease n=1 Tax=Mesorhizobium sp. PUT5 TaxID=3454629 RepID=UPI003FA46B01
MPFINPKTGVPFARKYRVPIPRSLTIKHFDHKTPLADGGKHSETNLQIACVACHVQKTAGEATERAQVRAVAKSVLGLKPKPKQKIPSPPKSPKPAPKLDFTSRRLLYAQKDARS